MKCCLARTPRTGPISTPLLRQLGTRLSEDAFGAPIAKVEVQVDGGAWAITRLDHSEQAEFAWTPWSFSWTDASPGHHTVTSRAVDTQGTVQPAMDDPKIAKKRTYWESNGHVTRKIQLT